MASRLLEWSIVACFPAGIFLLLGLIQLPAFVDPCHAWGDGSSEPRSTPTQVASACVGYTSTHETKSQALTRLMLFQGTVLVALVVGLVGAARGQRLLVGAGAGLLVLISLPLMADYRFVFPLASALLFGLGLVLFPAPPAARLRGP